MSDEKPNFKITDRRLFNPDGTPRDIEREEEPAAVDANADAATGGDEQQADATEIVDAAYVARDNSPTSAAMPPPERGASAAASSAAPGPASTEADDPQEFLMLVEFVASFAADALGMVEHPGAGRGDVNLPLAKQCIDMLATLQRKTHGNLSAEEQHVFDLILSQLRMQYVRMSNAPQGQPPPRGFTGSDITGGR